MKDAQWYNNIKEWRVNGSKSTLIQMSRNSFTIPYSDITKVITERLKELESSTSLTHLSLNNIDLSKDGMIEAINQFIQNNKSITSLGLSNNKMTGLQLQAILPALKSNQTIKEFQLDDNLISDEHGIAILADIIKHNNVLEILHLNGNELKHPDFKELIEALKINSHLNELNLCNNQLSDDVTKELSLFLQTNTSLVDISLYANRISHIGAIALIGGLKYNESILEFYVKPSFEEPIKMDFSSAIREYLNKNNKLFEDNYEKVSKIIDSGNHDRLKDFDATSVHRLINQLTYKINKIDSKDRNLVSYVELEIDLRAFIKVRCVLQKYDTQATAIQNERHTHQLFT